MIKIILKNGTQIEMDEYSREAFESIGKLAKGETLIIGHNKYFCRFCKIALSGQQRVCCHSKICTKKMTRQNSRDYYKRKMQRLTVAENTAPIETVPIQVA